MTEHTFFEHYATREEARLSIFHYIKVFTNVHGFIRHSAMCHLSSLKQTIIQLNSLSRKRGKDH